MKTFLERNAKNDGTGVEAHGLGYGCSRELRYNTTEGMDLRVIWQLNTLSEVLEGLITP